MIMTRIIISTRVWVLTIRKPLNSVSDLRTSEAFHMIPKK